MKRVLVADDHSLFRDGITSLLRAAGFEVVGEACNGLQAVDMAQRLNPDIVLMDINMPGLSGLQATIELKEKLPGIQVVMLTASEEDRDLYDALRAGADGYLPKSLRYEEFISLLQGLSRGEPPLPRHLTASLIRGISGKPTTDKQTPNSSKLTPREVEMMHYIAQGLSNQKIALKFNISENTVKFHLKHIYQKLQLNGRADAVAYALKNNY